MNILNRIVVRVACLMLAFAGMIVAGSAAASSEDGTLRSSVDATSRCPNVVFILADDLGWMDLASYAARTRGVDRSECYYETPNLDHLADQGMSFSQAYSCPLCSPARASILTGRYAARHGFLTASGHTRGSYFSRKMTPPEGYHIHDRKEVTAEQTNPAIGYITPSFTFVLQSGQEADSYDALTIPEALEGYRSAMVGKWHLGALGVDGYQPQDQGFETLAYFDHGGSHYFNWRDDWKEIGLPGEDLGLDYLTDDLTERAVRFIRECASASQPFFLYFPEAAVHSPREAKPEDIEYFSKKSNLGWNGHSSPEYAGVLRGLDNSVGRIMETLEQLGISENTLLIFMSDNGGIDRSNATSNAPLRDGKASKYEGGIRVPLIVRWPGKTSAGSLCDVPVDCNDIFPTVLSAAGQDAALASLELDGESLLPLFENPKNSSSAYSRKSFFWHAPFGGLDTKGNYKPAQSAMRRGNYKLLFDHQGYLELYDLSRDLSEENNLAAQMPEKTQALFAELVDWLDATVAERYMPQPNPLYSPEANAASSAPPYRDLRHELLGMLTAPVSKTTALKPAPPPTLKSEIMPVAEAREMRTWATGRPQQMDGVFEEFFVNPKGKTILRIKLPDGTLKMLGKGPLRPDDYTYLESIGITLP
jgi:arylsulfatase A-like enzyme